MQEELAEETPPPFGPAGELATAGCFVCFARGKTGPGEAGDPGWAGAALLRGDRVVSAMGNDVDEHRIGRASGGRRVRKLIRDVLRLSSRVRASPGNVRRPCRRRVGVPCLLCSFVYLVDVAGADASVRVCAHLIPQTKKLIMEGRFRGT